MTKGKKICETLKQIWLDIAHENGIDYIPNECHHEGDCSGTCLACDSELRYLEREISRKHSLGKAAVIGISLGISSISLSSCTCSPMGQVVSETTVFRDSDYTPEIINSQDTAEVANY